MSSSTITVGGRLFTFEDILKVAVAGDGVVLDEGAANKLADVSQTSTQTAADLQAVIKDLSPGVKDVFEKQGIEAVRAGLLIKMSQLLGPNSGVGRAVLTRLAEQLSESQELKLTASTSANGSAPAAAAAVDAEAAFVSAVSASLGPSPSPSEAAKLAHPDCCLVGRLCLSLEVSRLLQTFANCVFGLSAEALAVSPSVLFDPAKFENALSQNQSVTASAKQMRSLMDASALAAEASKREKTAYEERIAGALPLLSRLPRVAGALCEAVAGVDKPLRVEIRKKIVDSSAVSATASGGGGGGKEGGKKGKKEKGAKDKEGGAASSSSSSSASFCDSGVTYWEPMEVPVMSLILSLRESGALALKTLDKVLEGSGESPASFARPSPPPALALPSPGETPPTFFVNALDEALTFAHKSLLALLAAALSRLQKMERTVLSEAADQKRRKEEAMRKRAEEKGEPIPANAAAASAAEKKARLNCGRGTTSIRKDLLELASLPSEVEEHGELPNFTQILSAIEVSFGGLKLLGMKGLADKLEKAMTASNQETRRPKLPKGTQDFSPVRMAIREEVFRTITSVFKRHGAVQIDTPVFELRETLLGKYGEDQKLIYDLKDQGGELLSLRYDLTVPLARYCGSNAVEKLKRFHIGKVYRRDEPQMNRGRFREFYQCDIDICGSYDPMLPDAEILAVLVEILGSLPLGGEGEGGGFMVKLNHRKLLDALMGSCGVPPEKFRAICSAIDKLDKEPWEAVRKEMVEVKGLDGGAADLIGGFVVNEALTSKACGGTAGLVAKMKTEQRLATGGGKPELAKMFEDACEDLLTLDMYLRNLGAADKIVLDLSLARGLDYYTGVIYEAVVLGAGVGSVAAGGRYDRLVGSFSSRDVPAVGVSIGVERVFAVIERRLGIAVAPPSADGETGAAASAPASGTMSTVRQNTTDVLVCGIGGEEVVQAKRLALTRMLWDAGIACEFVYKKNANLKRQMDLASEQKIPILAMVGGEEVQKGTVKVRRLFHSDAEREAAGGEDAEKEVKESELVAAILDMLAAMGGTSADRMRRTVLSL